MGALTQEQLNEFIEGHLKNEKEGQELVGRTGTVKKDLISHAYTHNEYMLLTCARYFWCIVEFSEVHGHRGQ